ncbi:MAG TPA: ABC transporter ATP-binding protein [Acidimicrobiales bacterium]|nr:ABC transporter ATP-binding protein [Acidimicrobiales bacterium]
MSTDTATPPGEAPAADPHAALQLERVSASYGPYRALFDVSFVIPPGAVVALLGSNGAGKSTVARVVTGLLPATGGRVMIGGRDVTNQHAYKIARGGVAHVVEGRGVFANLTVEENLTLAFHQRAGRQHVAESLERAYAAFPVLGERRRQRGGTLSGGQQRILSLAKVLVVAPKLLVADELSLGLAPVVIDAVYEGLRNIHAGGCALLVVEQQVDRVLELADHAVVLEHGTVAFDGPPDQAVAAVERVLAARGDVAILAPEGSGRTAGAGAEHGDHHRHLGFGHHKTKGDEG